MATIVDEAEVEQRDIVRVADLLGGTATFEAPVKTALDAHEQILRGFPGAALTSLVANVACIQNPEALEKAVGISQRTLQRRKAEDKPKALSAEQSSRAWKFAEVVAKAAALFGSQEEGEAWLQRPAMGLNRRRPIDLLSTTAGTELVEQYLERIEYGVYA
jgi:putative toxin-antitoxin system antitoxin component (TIGR02293 family)